MVRAQESAPRTAFWTQKATALRAAAKREQDGVARQTLLLLAEDCEAIAAEIEAQQPGKPKPPGNPPPEEPDADRPRRREEPPAPIMPPRPEPPPMPLQTQGQRRLRR
ncbi:MAG TPA: hypothetical protein VE397_10525 [Stellaceae bacterium]|nr:hypothetical protein [Stellaceae bacterium]